MATFRERGGAVSVPVLKGSRAKGNGDLPRTRRSRERPGLKGSRAEGNGDLSRARRSRERPLVVEQPSRIPARAGILDEAAGTQQPFT
ncbi:hypothetical protein P5G61_21235 [Paenibacillus sp. F6_3S_P_1C]|uniref:Uncharacterized protein n=1 Tax=Paenibacillus vandeheii TaxID=3035917 RepID=A0ABT8JH24_9BACL|nr:hypothetical protein [Paenibacillus vandeheii]MDN4603782.1 hypothetical protein [Paenibacillus vandeheii]